jgi:hypothetical protein
MKKNLLLAGLFYSGTVLGQNAFLQIEHLNQIGDTGFDELTQIEVDASGNYYIFGHVGNGTFDMDFGPGTFNITTTTTTPILAKYDSNGDFIWAKSFSNNSLGYGNSLTLDAAGAIYVGGQYNGSLDMNPGAATNYINSTGLGAYLIKLDANGNFLHGFGHDGGSNIYDIAVKGNSLYCGGFFQNIIDFDPSASTVNKTAVDGKDAFLLGLDTALNFQSVYELSGTNDQEIVEVEIGSSNDIYAAGNFYGTMDTDNTGNTNNMTSNGTVDVFLITFSGGIPSVQYQLGGSAEDNVYSMELSATDEIFVGGFFGTTVDFNPAGGVNDVTVVGGYDAFLVKFSSNWTYQWVYTVGSTGFIDFVQGIDIDSNNDVYFTCGTQIVTDFDPGVGNTNFSGLGSSTVVKMQSNGVFSHAMSMGSEIGNGVIYPEAMVSLGGGDLAVVGSFTYAPRFESVSAPQTPTNAGSYDGFFGIYSTDVSASVTELSSSSILVFPNPAQEEIRIGTALNSTCEIFALDGKLMHSQYVMANSTLNIAALSEGMYILVVRTEDGNTFQTKLTKTH